jgi:hypothetical protein
MTRLASYIPLQDVLAYRKGKHRGVLVLQAYFDESGDEDRPFVCMAGCVADGKDWEKFEKDWDDILVAYGVSQLHTAQLMCYQPQEEYAGWDRNRCDCFVNDLIPIVLRTVKLYIATGENMFEHELTLSPKDDPYFNCLLTCIDGAASYVASLGGEEKVEMIFADHPEHSRRVRSLYPDVKACSGMYSRLASDMYGSPKDFLPLQAADLISWLYRRERERRAKGMQWQMSPFLERFKDQDWCNRGYFTFDKWPTERRPSDA